MRLPKKEYFEMRLANAIESGLTKKADYYKSRLAQMAAAEAPKKREPNTKKAAADRLDKASFTDTEKADLRARVKAKFDTLDESGQLIEANRFYKACEGKGISMNNAMALLSESGIDSTIVLHAMTF